MHVRNFWLKADIDGRSTRLTGGPQAKAGGLSAEILVRDNGSPVPAVLINAMPVTDNRLRVNVYVHNGEKWELVAEKVTTR